ncbi:hypothetical protein PACTADRAFT_50328 [Pachysolen tannophilus NRRL Y-2460]|uniref:PLP-dependent transferase n=1 Tax=Pachysolen tannophilus NRRL Y-2460 TaxID=669874 RepID=A0A1E4TV43_PACTA|nr:hypothetical protein PACTADRAFT_50328 [Pachysolen tannophilus NRRL Y-2460]
MTVTDQVSHVFQVEVEKKLPMAVHGKGAYISIEDPSTGETKTYIDSSTGAAVGSLGHGDPEVIEEMCKAAKESVYSFPVTVCNYAAEDLAEFIIQESPKGAFASALFTGSGSESNENAMKIIRQYHNEKGDTKRVKFISRKQSYHGYTLGALSIGDNCRKEGFTEILLPQEITPKVSQVYAYRNTKEGETLEQYKDRLLQEVEETFIENGPETVAAFICETVGGSTYGNPLPIPGYLDGVRDICHKYGALFMLDEVMCGMGRCGTLHAWEQFITLADGSKGFVGPDIQTIGKTLGSGYVTIAGVLVSPKVKDVFVNGSGKILGAQTYHSHAFNCRVALAVQKKVSRDKLVQNIYNVGNYLGERLTELLTKTKIVGDVRGRGGFWSFEIVKDQKTKEPFPVELDVAHKIGNKIYEFGATNMAAQGTIDGVKGDHILFAPSFIITKELVDQVIEYVFRAVTEVEAELGI